MVGGRGKDKIARGSSGKIFPLPCLPQRISNEIALTQSSIFLKIKKKANKKMDGPSLVCKKNG